MTPGGLLIHSVTGPVSAETLLQEAKWAIETYEAASDLPYYSRAGFVSNAHQEARMVANGSKDRQVHELLMTRPLAPLQSVYAQIFRDILGQRVSKAGPRLAQAELIIERAKRSSRPILFVLHDGESWTSPQVSTPTNNLLNEFYVIKMPLREAPALSQLTKQPPYETSSAARPLFVVTDSDCKQVRSVAGWNEIGLTQALAEGFTFALERNPPDVRKLVKAQRILRNANAKDAQNRVRELTIRVQEEAKKAELSKTAAL